jgi:hypothetical protein
VFNKIESMPNWSNCNTPACAGGNGGGANWMAQNQSTPSMDGQSSEVFNSGAWSNALWWQKFGANNAASNFLWDFWVQLDDASLTGAQALEYDAFQFVNGNNYMIGSECNYGYGVWDVWNEATNQWIHTSIPCPKFTPNVWHHIQWYVQRIPNSGWYRYVTLVVDGKAYPVNINMPAKYLAWPDNLGVQYQLDVNQTGVGFHEWINKSTLTIW